MNIRALVGGVLISCLSGRAQVDSLDATLAVYQLSQQEVSQFSVTDGQVSGFWGNWDGRDYIRMAAPDNCFPGRCNFNDSSDASVVLRAAATTNGLYLYVGVQDDSWVNWPDGDSAWEHDVVQLFFDQLSADSIWACPACLAGFGHAKITCDTREVLIGMGATSLPSGFYWNGCEGCGFWCEDYSTRMTFEVARRLYGFLAEVVQVGPQEKVQEWYLPWWVYGRGLEAGESLAGRRVAFSGGYNDRDGASDSVASLRWLAKDPWYSDSNTVNYWGDLLLPGDMPPVDTTSMAATARRVAHMSPSDPGTGAWYDLAGRRLRFAAASGTRGITIRRSSTGSRISAGVVP